MATWVESLARQAAPCDDLDVDGYGTSCVPTCESCKRRPAIEAAVREAVELCFEEFADLDREDMREAMDRLLTTEEPQT